MRPNRMRLSLALLPLLLLAAAFAWACDEEQVIQIDDGKVVKIQVDGSELIEVDEEGGQILIVTVDENGEKHVEKIALDEGQGEHEFCWRGDGAEVRAKVLALTGERSGAFLGVALDEVNDDVADEAGLRRPAGVLISSVYDDTAAEEAGLEAGDILLRVDGEKVGDVSEAVKTIRAKKPGDEVKLQIFRDGKKKTVEATLGRREKKGGAWTVFDDEDLEGLEHIYKMPGKLDLDLGHSFPDHPFLAFNEFMKQEQGPRLGVGIRDLDEDLAAYFPGSSEGSVLIEKVYEGSAAQEAGLKAGDVVLSFGGEKISDREALQKAVASADAGEVSMTVLRHGEKTSVSVQLPESERLSSLDSDDLIIKKKFFNGKRSQMLEQRMEELEKKLEKLMEKLESK